MNDFLLNIIASLNKQLSKRQLKADVKTMDNSMYVKVIAKLSMALSKRQLKKDIKELNDLYIQIGANVKIDKNTKSQLQKRIKELQSSIENIEIKAKVAKKNIGSEVDSARRAGQTRANKVPISFDLEIKKSKAISDIEYLGKRFSKLFSNASAKQKCWECPKVCVNLQTGVRYNYSVWRFLLWQEEKVTHHRKQQCVK